MQYLIYYLKKFWYLWVLIILCVIAAFIFVLNGNTLIFDYEKYVNKVELDPSKFVDEPIEDISTALADLELNVSYMRDDVWLPKNIVEFGGEDAFKDEVKKDPYVYYKKQVNWSSGEITDSELEELIELTGYHLNKTTSKKIVVTRPTVEELIEFNVDVMYTTDAKGILSLNLKVEEYNESTSTKKVYLNTFKLRYDMDGRINFK